MNPVSSLAGLRPPRVAGLNFTAVDFETANGFRGSPCAIGLVRVRDGNVDELYFRRIRPPAGFDRFDPRNTAVHGITAERVADEPRFAEVFSEVAAFIGSDTLVAHNAAFDVEVFESSLEVSGLDSPGLRALCSVRLARAVYKLDSHALPSAAAEAGFNLKHHHHALWDARAAAAIVVDIAQREKVGDLHALFGRHFIAPQECEPWSAPRDYESRATRQVRSYGNIFDARAAGADDGGLDDDELPELMQWQDEGPTCRRIPRLTPSIRCSVSTWRSPAPWRSRDPRPRRLRRSTGRRRRRGSPAPPRCWSSARGSSSRILVTGRGRLCRRRTR